MRQIGKILDKELSVKILNFKNIASSNALKDSENEHFEIKNYLKTIKNIKIERIEELLRFFN